MTQNYREDPNFNDDFVFQALPGKPRTPFAVSLHGIFEDGPFLGVGQVVGVTDKSPVIEVEDRDGEVIQLLGNECWFSADIPDVVIERVETSAWPITSVKTYLQTLRTTRAMEDELNSSGLDDTGIDPESL